MKFVDWIREHGHRVYDLAPAIKTLNEATLVEQRIDHMERQVSERTGHPIGDVIERRRPPTVGQKGVKLYALHH